MYGLLQRTNNNNNNSWWRQLKLHYSYCCVVWLLWGVTLMLALTDQLVILLSNFTSSTRYIYNSPCYVTSMPRYSLSSKTFVWTDIVGFSLVFRFVVELFFLFLLHCKSKPNAGRCNGCRQCPSVCFSLGSNSSMASQQCSFVKCCQTTIVTPVTWTEPRVQFSTVKRTMVATMTAVKRNIATIIAVMLARRSALRWTMQIHERKSRNV